MYTLVAKSEDEEIPKSVLFGKTSTEADLQRQGIVHAVHLKVCVPFTEISSTLAKQNQTDHERSSSTAFQDFQIS